MVELKNYVVKDKRKNIIFWAFERNIAWELKYWAICGKIFINNHLLMITDHLLING
jgi:hypothetical protein